MTPNTEVLSVYDGFFSGGARIVHTDIIEGLHTGAGQDHSVVSINGQVEREFTVQKIEDDNCYQRLREAGIEVVSLGRVQSPGEQPAKFTEDELRTVQQKVDASDVVMSLKEQPLRLLNQIDTTDMPLVVCLHRSDPENQGEALAELLEAVGSDKVSSCVCCADSTRKAYQEAGVPEELLSFIPNGIDLRRYAPSEQKHGIMRQELGIPFGVPAVLFAARYDNMKNVPLFLKSARDYLEMQTDAHVIMCGAGMSMENADLAGKVEDVFGEDEESMQRVHMLGIRKDMDLLYAGSDIITLTSSFGEAYPLTLVEGMASGLVPVATDVGDTREIIGGRGIISEPSPEAIAISWAKAYIGREVFLRKIATDRPKFGRDRMIGAYANLIADLQEDSRGSLVYG